MCYNMGIMKISKAIIPVAGWGTRRLPITKIIEKSMLPVGNRPLVDYSVQQLIEAGVKDIYMVVSNVEPCQVRAFYQDNLALNLYLRERGKEDKLEKAKTLPDDVTIHYVAQDPSAKYGTAVPVALVVEEYNINDVVLSVDGGVTDKTIDYCRDCDIVVSGSYIINSNNRSEEHTSELQSRI